MKIKNQLWLTHGLLVVVSLIIVLTNVIAYQGIGNDALIINQSGKLRALSYNMVQLTNQIENQIGGKMNVKLHEDLQLRVDEFDSTLTTLSDHRKTSKMSINHNQSIVRLEKIIVEWKAVYKPLFLQAINNESSDKLSTQVNDEIESFVNHIDEMVMYYSIYSSKKVSKALAINAGLILFVIMITFYSFASTFKRVQKPLENLMEELKEISLMDDDLSQKLKNLDADEISEMTHYFNEMLYDQLTKTFNRRAGLAKLKKLMQHGNRRNLEMSLCFIDINGLKIINDQLGHKYGDQLIIDAVDIIKKEIRHDDFIIRMGGDEFLIAFIGINAAISEEAWKRICKRYKEINEQEDRLYNISVSHGISEYDHLEKTEIEKLIKVADMKMYEEKRYIKENLDEKIVKDMKL